MTAVNLSTGETVHDGLSLAGNLIENAGSVREALRQVLRDENGLPPTLAATDVIMAVVESINYTDERHSPNHADLAPTFKRYALDAEQLLRIRRKNR